METKITVTTNSAATASTTNVDVAKVQRVTKKSSDELLRKFAQLGNTTNDNKQTRLIKRRKKRMETQCESSSNGGLERRSLLPPTLSRRSVLLRQLRVRDNRNKSSLLVTIHKTWRRTVEGASRVFMEKQYHCHKRLISDMV